MSNLLGSFRDEVFTLDEIHHVRFKIMIEEWPAYAKEHNLEDPWARNLRLYKMVQDGCKPQKESIFTWQEISDYRFEESKFVIKRLVDQGYYDQAQQMANDALDPFGNNSRLQAYLNKLLLYQNNEIDCAI